MSKQTKRSTEWHDQLEKKVFSDPEAVAEYETFRVQFELAQNMRKKRAAAHLTQEEVALRMRSTKPAVSRLESTHSLKHSPSISTLCRYAAALGMSLKINFIPLKTAKHKS